MICHTIDDILDDDLTSIFLIIFKIFVAIVLISTSLVIGNKRRSIFINLFILTNCWNAYHNLLLLPDILNILFLCIWWYIYINIFMKQNENIYQNYDNQRRARAF